MIKVPYAFSLILLAAAASAQPEPAGEAGALLGNWRGACEAWGTRAVCRLRWETGLHPEHLVLHYRIEAEADGRVIFAGRGLYRGRGETFDGYWEDSQGSVHPLRARFDGATMTTLWGDAASGEQGRSEYRLVGPGQLRVTDSMRADEDWRDFMTVDYRRDE